MRTTSKKSALRGGLRGWLAGGLLTAAAATVFTLPVAQADPGCNQDVGSSINSYLEQHPSLHQQLIAKSQAEGDGGNVVEYLDRHPDVRQHLIDLSHSCPP
jgi:hypothetical protein